MRTWATAAAGESSVFDAVSGLPRDVVMIRAPAPSLREVVERAERLFGDRLPAGKIESHVDPKGGVALLQAEAVDAPLAMAMHKQGREAFTFRGFVNEPDPSPAFVRRLIRIDESWWGKPLVRMERSPGGIASFFLADGLRSRCFAWSGLPGVEGVFHTSARGVTVVSSSSLLSHLLATGRDRPEPCMSWGRHILLGDSTLWDDTPYEGTRYAPARGALLVDRSGVHRLPHPLAIGSRFAPRSQEAIEALVDEALRSMEIVRRLGPTTIHLSGGKDSRMVATLAARAGLDVDCLTYAPGEIGEGAAAAQVARFLKLPHRSDVPVVSTGDDLLATMLVNLRRSEGLLNENRQLAYAPQESQRGRPLLEGQAHHPRGGYLTGSKPSWWKVRRRLHNQLTRDRRLVREEITAERKRRIDMLVLHRLRRYPADLSYWMYADWRASRWLQPAYAATWAMRPLHWPMMDERVLQLCARLAAPDRSSEYTFFAVLERLAPGIGNLPLYDDTWRFDAGGPDKTPFPEGFEQRNRPVQEPPGQRPRTPEKRMATIHPLFRWALHDLRCSQELRSWIRPDALPVLLEGGDGTAALGVDSQQVTRFMWKTVAIGLVLDGLHLTNGVEAASLVRQAQV